MKSAASVKSKQAAVYENLQVSYADFLISCPLLIFLQSSQVREERRRFREGRVSVI